VENTIKIAAAVLAFLILLVVGASTSNSSKYYLFDNQGTLEIWQGKFAPLGKKQLIALPGVAVPETIKDVYRSDEVYPLAFEYYIDEADAMLDVSGIPDFEKIKDTLKTALEYGSTKELQRIAYARLDNIDRLILSYKAEVASSRGTIDDLNAAIGFLEEVSNLTADEAQKEIIAQKIADHEVLIQQMEEQAAAEAAAAEQAAAAEAAEAEAEQQAAEVDAAADEAQIESGDTEEGPEAEVAQETSVTETEAEHH
jgi:hypothetical protein